MKELGVSLSTVERRIRITGIPTHRVDGRTVFDLETLQDAWAGHRAAVEQEKADREKNTETQITFSLPQSMRDELDARAAQRDVSVAAVLRELVGAALR